MPQTARPQAHNVISTGGSGRLIIAADFPATARTVAGFTDLFAGDAAPADGDAVWETAPPPTGAAVAMSASDHIDRWMDDVPAGGSGVRAVLGFCIGAVYAAALTERVAKIQVEPPQLIVFDPERPDPDLLLRHYSGVFERLGPAASAQERTAALDDGRQARGECGTMAELADSLSGLFLRHGAPILARTGLDEWRQQELRSTFAGFLAYLVAADELDPLPAWSQATAISSGTAHSGLNPLPADVRARTVARELRFAVPHTELLRDAEVIRHYRDLMKGGAR
jgi:hypothetical protein